MSLFNFLKLINSLFLKNGENGGGENKKSCSNSNTDLAKIDHPVVSDSPKDNKIEYKEYITLNDWITSSNQYPERAKSPELSKTVIENAKITIRAVNGLLNELRWDEKIFVSSGFRPSNVNSQIKNAAKRSAHSTGLALDIRQPKSVNRLGLAIRDAQSKNKILNKYGLMMEALEFTVGNNSTWVHLDRVPRSPRPNNEFKP